MSLRARLLARFRPVLQVLTVAFGILWVVLLVGAAVLSVLQYGPAIYAGTASLLDVYFVVFLVSVTVLVLWFIYRTWLGVRWMYLPR